jgi:hypothetical protein
VSFDEERRRRGLGMTQIEGKRSDARAFMDSRNAGAALLVMLLGGIAGVLLLDKRMSWLIYSWLRGSKSSH